MSDTTPLVSIITPNYNGAAFLAETIDSVRSQTYTHWEMIIVDDCSNDNSAELIRTAAKTEPRIQPYFLTERSGGPAKPRNYGLDAAQGKYVVFLDNDDLWHPQKLEFQVMLMQLEGVAISSVAMFRFQERSEIPPSMWLPIPTENVHFRKITYEMLLRRHCTPHLMAERRLFLDYAIRFDEREEYNRIEDMLCWFMLHQHVPYSIKLSPPLTFYRQHSTSLSAAKLPIIAKQRLLYGEQRVGGKPIGWRFPFYFTLYAVRGVLSRVAAKLNITTLNVVDY
ncbi:MAG: glycosyltransferase family 2 protein [Candidatus Kapabacteria bacterium]|nr:glycosyltransferase family 2 protein [Candidatus Kapabacteria bacterium]